MSKGKKIVLIIAGSVLGLYALSVILTPAFRRAAEEARHAEEGIKHSPSYHGLYGATRTKTARGRNLAGQIIDYEVKIERRLELKEDGRFNYKETSVSSSVDLVPFTTGAWQLDNDTVVLRKEDGSVFIQGKLIRQRRKAFDVAQAMEEFEEAVTRTAEQKLSGGPQSDRLRPDESPEPERWCIIENDETVWIGPKVQE